MNWANQILEEIFDEETLITPRQGVYILGLSQFVAAVISMWAVTRFGRKTLLLFGHAGSFILLFMLALCLAFDYHGLTLTLICAYAFVFNVSNATVVNVYLVEVCTDIALGAAMVVMQLIILLETSSALYIINWFGAAGFFFMYSVFSLAGFIFIYNYVGETMNLTDKEKLMLYHPGQKYGAKALP